MQLELLSKYRKDIGTKCTLDLLLLGQNVVGTYGFWDKMYLGHLAFGTNHWILGYFWDKGIGTKCQWDKLPRGKGSVGQFT